MRKLLWIIGTGLLLGCAGLAQDAKKDAAPTVASEAGMRLQDVGRELVASAEAMPEAKFSYAPTSGKFEGVRNFGQQIKHVAAYNYILCGAIRGEKPPADTNGENGPEALKSKAEIVKYLKDSLQYCEQGIEGLTLANALEPILSPLRGPATRLALVTRLVGHGYDHYGQLVVYMRHNGIVPPSTARRQQR
jgi:uncharacterized damage-inducible protein DinB